MMLSKHGVAIIWGSLEQLSFLEKFFCELEQNGVNIGLMSVQFCVVEKQSNSKPNDF
jgi:hypothetical protein